MIDARTENTNTRRRERLDVVSTIAAVVALGGISALLYSGNAFGAGPLTLGLQAIAIVAIAWARVTLGRRSFHGAASPTPGALVTSGPYAVVRNPIYAGSCLFVWAGVANHLELIPVLLGACVVGAMVVRVRIEEQFLRRSYSEYPSYARRTPKRLVPLVF